MAYTGVTADQWDEIRTQAARFGDPNNCEARVAAISNNADVTVKSGDVAALNRALASAAKVIRLQGGTYSISTTIRLDDQRQLVGAPGKTVTIDASGVDRAVILDNAVLANLAIRNAEDKGVMLRGNSLAYQVSVGRTGYGPTVNRDGTGFSISSGSANNCVVSTEAFEGYNEDGQECEPCYNGGNADGYGIKFGARNNTIIDSHGYRNSDDGYDFWEGDTTFVYFGSTFDNGKIPDRPSGDGNGFKLGRGDAVHYLYRAKAYRNLVNGFDLNGNLVKSVLVQTESYDNGGRDYVGVGN